MKAFLVIGDSRETRLRPAKPFKTFVEHSTREAKNKKNLELKIVSYGDVLSNRLPAFIGSAVNIILFFPFVYWNRYIEVYNKDQKVYGEKAFGKNYKSFFDAIEEKIKKAYKGKKIVYFNPPKASLLERDKKRTKSTLKKKGISVPKTYSPKNINQIKKFVSSGKSLYIKPRFGSLGKGITYIDKNKFVTNFKFKNGKIISHKSDYGWKFRTLKERDRNIFLRHLIRRDFLFEEGIEHPRLKGKKYDFRVHVIQGKTPYYYAKTVSLKSPITNWAQGGKIEKKDNLHRFISRGNAKKVRSLAVKTAKALNLSYAAVDVVVSKDFKNVYCLEAHSFPGYEKRYDIMKYIAKRIVK
ncbi:MAG: hypothetical protein HQ579_03385 [Candidatus Omnitrophica bacterium]|nr:hypothetical protein [Candidatus Omnitrophota bacterium]